MSYNRSENRDYDSLGSSKKNDAEKDRDRTPLENLSNRKNGENSGEKSLVNYDKKREQKNVPPASVNGETEPATADDFILKPNDAEQQTPPAVDSFEDETYAKRLKIRKQQKQTEKDFKILKDESWVVRNGHFLTYIGLYCFSVLVFFRPYELIPGLGFLAATAFYAALATLLLYLPTQLATEGTLTTLSTEVKCIIVITALAVILMPLAKSPAMAWEEFNDSFSKAVVMFVVMVNVLRTRRRLLGIIWISLAAGFVLSYMALGMYLRGEISVEGYRVAVEIGGMFGNPNELSLHLVMMTPIAFCLGLAAKNTFLKYIYYITAALFVAANVVTYSRGGFLGFLAFSAVLIWKLGKQNRAKIFAVASVFAVLFILLAPGEYGNRIFSIFDSSLDAVGSSDQRTELLKRSIVVTLRNPWGIGIGNFPIVGVHNLGTHNTYTQISAELGITSLAAYLIFLISPFRKLAAIERRLLVRDETGWFYYLAVGLQASIVAFMVSSFFAAVAYNWFVYYLIAYAVAFRRIYLIEKGLNEEDVRPESITENLFGRQSKPK
jgi:putative inorganic carbon (hco3(-)) transporter